MRVWLCVSAVLALGCGELEPGPGLFPAQDGWIFDMASDGGDARVGASDAGPDAAPLADPVGTWAVFVEDRKCLSAVGTTVENVVWTWARLEILETTTVGGSGYTALRQRFTLCSQDLSPLIGGLRTIVPAAIVERLHPIDWSATLLGRAPGSGYVSAELVDLWGATGVALDEPIPVDGEDPRLEDSDQDGEPGVTFVVGSGAGEACRVHVVQRTRLNFDGQVLDATHIAGALGSVIEKTVLSATSPLCNSSTDLVPSPTPSRFWMARVDGVAGGLNLDLNANGVVGCDEILASDAVLSGPTGVARLEPDNSVCGAD